jgi:hypothetical protein
MTAQQLSTLWESIERSGTLNPSAVRFLDTGVDSSRGSVLVGLDGAGQRHLCIPAPTGELDREDRRSRGVTIEVRPLLNREGRATPFVDVHCRRPELNALFETVATDILAESQKKTDSPFATAHTVLERWRELLEPAEGAALGPKQLAALLAELLLLERLGRNGIPALKYWLGPDKGPHDFVCGAVDFEVKSTLSTTRREVEIHGLAQLMESPRTTLHLWWIRLRPSPGRGTTVPDTIDRLLASGADASTLVKNLKLEGYVQADAPAYRNIHFELVESALYTVNADFPRLMSGSFVDGLPPQITRVDYTINLDASKPVPMEQAAAETVFDSVGSRA